MKSAMEIAERLPGHYPGCLSGPAGVCNCGASGVLAQALRDFAADEVEDCISILETIQGDYECENYHCLKESMRALRNHAKELREGKC